MPLCLPRAPVRGSSTVAPPNRGRRRRFLAVKRRRPSGIQFRQKPPRARRSTSARPGPTRQRRWKPSQRAPAPGFARVRATLAWPHRSATAHAVRARTRSAHPPGPLVSDPGGCVGARPRHARASWPSGPPVSGCARGNPRRKSFQIRNFFRSFTIRPLQSQISP